MPNAVEFLIQFEKLYKKLIYPTIKAAAYIGKFGLYQDLVVTHQPGLGPDWLLNPN